MNLKKVFAAAMAVVVSGSMFMVPGVTASKNIMEVSAASVNNANLIIDFGSYSADPGDYIVVSPIIKNNGGKFAVSAIDVDLDVDSPLEITAIGGTSAAFNGAIVSYNLDQYKASLTPLTNNEPTVPIDNETLFKLRVKVPDDCPDGVYNIGFGDKVEIFKGSLNSDKWSYQEIVGQITVGNGAVSETTTTTTTTTTTAAPVNKVAIVEQPVDVKVPEGKKASVSVSATGDGLSYQWYVCSPTGTKFTKSSLTTSTYSYAMTESKSGRKVYCVITDAYGNSVKTDTVTMSMSTPLAIVEQPSDAFAAEGKKVSATVTATGEGLTYQWYICSPNGSKFGKSSITDSTYSYKMTADKNGRKAYCVITDQYGESVTTDTVTFYMGTALEIVEQPSDASAAIGSVVKTKVTAVGEDLTYEWYVSNPGSTKFSKSSITKATYSYAMTASKSGRKVYCVITDKYGNSVTTDTVTLTAK